MDSEMNIPGWDKKYEIGVDEIDFQHQYFLKLINRFYKKINEGLPNELVSSHLNELFLYTQFHFCSEENLMKLYGYPDFENHQKEHINIVQVLSNKIGLFELNELSGNEIVLFLIDWFLEHTIKEDVKLAPYMK